MSNTSSEPRLTIHLNPASGVPFYRQIIEGIERAVHSGGLKPGDKLPTIRSLAIELKMNPNTIAKAYGELESRGVVTTQVGSGTYVAEGVGSRLESQDLAGRIEEIVERCLRDLAALGVPRQDVCGLFEKKE